MSGRNRTALCRSNGTCGCQRCRRRGTPSRCARDFASCGSDRRRGFCRAEMLNASKETQVTLAPMALVTSDGGVSAGGSGGNRSAADRAVRAVSEPGCRALR